MREKIINMKSFEAEIEKIPEFMRRVVITMDRSRSVLERRNILSSQLEKKQSRLLLNN